jgi:hypothetical protein
MKIIFWKLFDITLLILFVGKKPPPETNVILMLSELNNLNPEKFNNVKIIMLSTE